VADTPASSEAAEPPVPTLAPAATATSAPRFARIANTSGQGVNLRREPSPTAPPAALLQEGAVVRLLGGEQSSGGRVWRQVADARGNEGWTPADFLVDDPGPAR
jgi:SH3-like domain-containing protein